MKKIITLLFCLMFVLGMIISCDNGEMLEHGSSDLKGEEYKYYFKDYDDIVKKPTPQQ